MRRGIDAGRLSRAVARPGIDPRVWLELGVVRELGFDAAEGVFADVMMQPNGNVETCYVGGAYAGSVGGAVGFGDWCPVEVGDTVLVGIPGGDTNRGPVIIARWWNSGDPPPAQVGEGDEPSRDRWAIVKPGRRFELLATVAGAIAGGGTQVTTAPAEWKCTSQAPGGATAATASLTPTGVAIDSTLPLSIELGGPAAMPLAHAVETLAQGAAGAAGIVAVQTALATAVSALAAIGAAPLTGASAAAAFGPAMATLGTALATMASTLGAAAATLPTQKVRGA